MVQDLFLTETAEMADVVFPAASFAEKNGAYTNVEHRVHKVAKALAPAGESKPDLDIFVLFAEAMGSELPYESPEDVMEEIDWSIPEYADRQGRELPEKYRLKLDPWKEPESQGDPKTYPFVLHPQTVWFHSGSFSTHSPSLMDVFPSARIGIHEEDAGELGLNNGDMVRLVSEKGEVEGMVATTDFGPRGVIQMAHHFPDQPVNSLIGWGDRIVRVRVEKGSA